MAIGRFYKNITRQRKSVSDNGFGGQIEVWTAGQTTISGLIDWTADNAVNAGGQFTTILKPTLWTTPTADITQDDRVIYKGKTYRVVNIPDDVTERGHHLEVALEHLEGAE